MYQGLKGEKEYLGCLHAWYRTCRVLLLWQGEGLLAEGPDEGVQQGAVVGLSQPVSGCQLLDAV